MPTTGHTCKSDNLNEVRLSNCAAGCKILACPDCPAEFVAHSAIYGCEQAADDFRPMDGPSLAGIHRRWLDRGLPSETWVRQVANLRGGERL